MITRINKSKTLTKIIPCNCKCKSDGRNCNFNQKWNNEKCRCECENPINIVSAMKIIFGACACKINKYLQSIVGDLIITCD